MHQHHWKTKRMQALQFFAVQAIGKYQQAVGIVLGERAAQASWLLGWESVVWISRS